MSQGASAERAGEERLLAVLGLGPGAEEEEIRTAYRRLARRWHPDSSRDPGTAGQFARVARAYKVLSARPPRSPAPMGCAAAKYRRVIEAGEDLFALGQVLASDPEAGAREAAARRLGLSGRTAAYVFLRRALYDPAEEVAAAAVRSVALLGARQAEGEVAALYSRATPGLKRLVLETALAPREPLFKAAVRAASKDEDPSLRVLAARAAAGE